MKPFNLEGALAGDPVVMRSGEEVVRVVYLKEVAGACLKVVYVSVSGDMHLVSESGLTREGLSYQTDLFMATRKVTMWTNVYGDDRRDEDQRWASVLYASEKEARRDGHGKYYIATVPVTWEE